VDELGITGYSSVKRKFLNIFDDDDDDEEMKKDFLMKNAGWISLGVFFGVLWV
jgi:hypothetical protein